MYISKYFLNNEKIKEDDRNVKNFNRTLICGCACVRACVRVCV